MDCSSLKCYQPFSGYLENDFSLGSKTKTQLLEECNSLDEVGARHFYFEILKEIKNSIFSDRIEIFQLLSDILSHLNKTLDSELIQTWQQDAHKLNGTFNLIIFACKWASIKILEYLLSNENNFCKLPFLTGKDDLSPDEEDEECHNTFYYAIRSNEERILQILIDKWPNAYFEEHFNRLDDILSKAYEDLVLKNVYICKNMEVFVKGKLVDLRFFQEKSTIKVQKMPKGKASNDTQKFKDLVSNRIDFVSERIDNIKESFWNSEPDEQFILSAKYIVKNLFTLKSNFIFVNKLPWEEIEFCLIIFIHCCSNHFQKDPLYHFVLNKRRILSYLSNFSKLLKTVKEQLKKANVNKTGKIVIKEIDGIDNNEEFKELYSDFSQVRDLYSIETIRSSIDLAISADATTKNGQLVIVRALQVIGEHFKFSKDSPKLTEATSELLLAAFPGNIKEIITRLRDSVSHSESISMRSEIEKNTPSFFAHMQKDIAKMKVTMSEIRRRTAVLMIRTVLDRIVRCGKHSEMKQFVSQNHISVKFLRKELEESDNLVINDMNELERLISNLENEINKELNKSKELFSDVHDIIRGRRVEEPRYYSRLSELFESAIPGDKEGYKSHLLHSYFVTPASEMAAFAQDLTKVRMNYGKFNQILRGIGLRNQLGALVDGNENLVTEEEIEQFTELISVLEKITDEKSENETAVLQRIRNLIQTEKTRLNEVGRVFNQVISSFLEILLKKENESTVVTINRFVHQIQSKLAILTVSLGFKSFSRELNSIANQIILNGEFVREAGVITALTDISNFLQFHMGNIKWVKDFRHMLQNDKKQEPGKNKKSSDLDDDTEIYLKNALSLLENTMCDYHLNELNPEKIENCEKNPEIRFLIEMLVLDVLSVLEYNFLSHDPYFLDNDFPILNGRNLRNHLAHGNALVSLVLGDDFTNVLLNAKKLLSTKDHFRDKLIGKKTENNPYKSKESFNRYLSVIKQQNNLSVALANGNIDEVIFCIKEGADLRGKSTDLSNSLHFAAKGTNLELMKFLLKFFPDINECNLSKQTFLHVAAANGTLNAVEYVLKGKITYIDSQDIDGKTPLHLASENGHIDVVQYLLEHGAKTTIKAFNGLTPLHLAVLENHYDIVLTLLEKEEHVDATQAFYGVTCLHLASGRGHLKLVEALKERGADVNFYSDMHLTPLHYAARGGHRDVVEFLIANKAEVNATSVNGLTPLHWAVEEEKEEIVIILLQNGACLNSIFVRSLTPLSLAAKVGNVTIWKLLLEKGSIFDLKTDSKITPFQYATYYGHSELLKFLLKEVKEDDKIMAFHRAVFHGHQHIVELLLDEGVDVHARCGGMNALHIAANKGHTYIVDFLIDKGIDINSQSTGEISDAENQEHSEQLKLIPVNPDFNTQVAGGQTALHFSSSLKHVDTVQLLLKKKADISIKDDDGITPLQILVCNNLTKLLMEEEVDVNFSDPGDFTALHFAAAEGDLEFVEYCIAKGCDIDAKDELGITALHMAAQSNHKHVIKFLLDKGSNIDSACNDGSTAVSIAAEMNHKDILSLLIDKKERQLTIDAIRKGHDDIVEYFLNRNPKYGCADINNQEFPLHIAVYNGHISIVKKLLEVGDKKELNIKDNLSMTPLFIATELNRREIVQLLLSKGADPNIPMKKELEILPINEAAAQGNSELLDMLLKALTEKNVKLTDSICAFTMEQAIKSKNLNTVKILMKYAEIDVNTKTSEGYGLLHFAIISGSLEIVKFLVDQKADIDARDSTDAKPLHCAAREGHQDMVEYFLDLESDVNSRGKTEWTALHYAAAGNHPEICEFLLRKNLDVNAVDLNGCTPLHIASVLDNKNVVLVLLKHGAHYNARNKEEKTPLEVAAYKDTPTVTFLLLIENLFTAVKKNSSIEVKVLLTKFSLLDCVNVKNEKNVTPLHFAAWKGYEEVVHVLLEYGANPNSRADNEGTPLHYASRFSHLRIIKSLLNYGANFESLSYSKKLQKMMQPVDFAENQDIIRFLEFLKKTFAKTCLGEVSVIDDLQSMADFETAKAVMRARNAEGRTLTAVAIVSNHPESKKMMQIFQDDVSFALERAGTCFEQGQYEESAKQYRTVLLKRMMLFDISDPAVLDVQAILSDILLRQKKLSQALPLAQSTYQKQKEILGENYEGTLAVECQIGLITLGLGRHKEALEIFRKVSNKQKDILGSNNPKTLQTLLHLAKALQLMGELEEALKMSEEVLSEVIENLEIGDLYLKAQSVFAQVLLKLGRHNESLAIYEEVCQKRGEILGLCHPDTLQSYSCLALVLLRMGRKEEALESFKENVSRLTAAFGLQHPDTLKERAIVADILFSQTKYYEALQIYQADIEARSSVLGPNHVVVLDTRRKMDFILTNLKIPVF